MIDLTHVFGIPRPDLSARSSPATGLPCATALPERLRARQTGKALVRAGFTTCVCALPGRAGTGQITARLEHQAEVVGPAAVSALVGANKRRLGLGVRSPLVQHDAKVGRRATVPELITPRKRGFGGGGVTAVFVDETQVERPVAITSLGPARIGHLSGREVLALVIGQQPEVCRRAGVAKCVGVPPCGLGTRNIVVVVEQHESALELELSGRRPLRGGTWVLDVELLAVTAHVM